MVDPVIDEHFRRSLGADYMTLFVKNKDGTNKTPLHSPSYDSMSPKMASTPPTDNNKSIKSESPIDIKSTTLNNDAGQEIEMSVDDHFAKALGDTWKQLRQRNEVDVGQSS